MMRLTGLLLAALLVGGVAAVGLAEDAAKLYATKCAMCHGKKGEGNVNMAKAKKMDNAAFALTDAATLKKTDLELIEATAEGMGTPSASGTKPMPAYKGKIAEGDIAALVTYIRTLAPPVEVEAPLPEKAR